MATTTPEATGQTEERPTSPAECNCPEFCELDHDND